MNSQRSWAVVMVVVLALVSVIPLAGVSRAEMPAPLDVRGYSAALAPDGDLWAVWSADDGHNTELFYSRWARDGWLPARPVYVDAVTWDDFPSLAFAADGTPWVAWSSADREQSSLYVSRWAGYRWSRPERVPADPTSRPRQPALAAAPDGGFWLAWIGFDGNDDEIYASHWDGLSWSEPERVGRDDTDSLAYDTHPRLAVDGSGLAWLVWVSSDGLFDDVVVASRWNGMDWTPEQLVSSPDDTPDVWPSLALDSEGQPWLAWQDVAGSGADTRWRIHVAHWLADDATWSAEEMVSSPVDLPWQEERPSLSFDAHGKPHLAWAVSGALSGVAYATREGSGWTEPAWAAEQVAAEAPVVLSSEAPWVLWESLALEGPIPVLERQLTGSAEPLPHSVPQSDVVPLAQCIYNRYVAWGDSITWGLYDDPEYSGIPVGDYPTRLEEKLDARVKPSEVINLGIPGERAAQLWHRIGGEAMIYLPQFPLIMSGTNDVSSGHSPSAIAEDLALSIDGLRKFIDIDGIRPWLSTIIPRLDNLNDETAVVNDHIRALAATKRVPYADHWQAYYEYGAWKTLYRDYLHPNREGMQVLTDSWYTSILDKYSWLYEDVTAPETWIEPLPPQTLCGDVVVQWDGSDDVSWIEDFDVQVQLNYGAWTDWLVATEATGETYVAGSYGDTVGFRVRGRDAAGNQNDYSDPVYTQIVDEDPPYDVQVNALPPARKAPFVVSWSGVDDCGEVAAFDVQYRVGLAGTWESWLSSTPFTIGLFDPSSPQYGETYYFQARARDEAGNWSAWSDPVSTILAKFTLSGHTFNVRHERVAHAGTVLAPAALSVQRLPGGYEAFVAGEGDYDISTSRDGFGILPPMSPVSVTEDLVGLDFVLPPLDDVVSDGGFEAGAWGDWLPAGTAMPSLITGTHTGNGAVLLGGTGETSSLSQVLTVPDNLSDATLSLLVRLDDDEEGSSTLQIELAGTVINYTQVVSPGGWTHVWLPVDDAAGQTLTLSFHLSDTPAVRLDEVSLGSAAFGGAYVHLPVVLRPTGP